jgi:hypothetical protein
MSGKRRTAVVAGAVLAALLIPATVLASHIFSDVPTSMTGHAAIDEIYHAGITGGCGGTRYCPTDAVTRAQMALFMQRGYPRIAYASGETAASVGGGFTILSATTLRTSGGAGHTHMLEADASANFEVTAATGCPCDIQAELVIDGVSSLLSIVTVPSGGSGWFTIAMTGAREVPTNTPIVVDVRARVVGGTPTIAGFSDISAIAAPFGCDCDSTVSEYGPMTGPRAPDSP